MVAAGARAARGVRRHEDGGGRDGGGRAGVVRCAGWLGWWKKFKSVDLMSWFMKADMRVVDSDVVNRLGQLL